MITGTASEPPADVSGQTVIWNIPELNPGESNVIRITVTGSFSEEGPTGSLNSGILTAREIVDTISFFDSGIEVIGSTKPIIEIVKTLESGPKEIGVEDKGNWELLITVTNPTINNEVIEGIIVRDDVNWEMDISSVVLAEDKGTAEYDNLGGRINWYGFDLEVGESATLRITLTGLFSAQGHKVLNSGNGYGTGADTGRVTNFADFADSGITVIGATQPVIEIVKTIESGPIKIEQGQFGNWELLITVTNPTINTETLVNNVILDDVNLRLGELFVGLEAQTGSASYDGTSRRITWNDFNLGVGDSTTLRITLWGIFSEEGTEVLNTGSGSGIGQDTGLQTDFAKYEDSGITVIGKTLLNVSKVVVGPDPIDVNTEGTWDLVITVDNPSLDVVTDLELTDEVIGNLTITGTVSDPSASYDGQVVKWDIPQLKPEESKTLIITVTGSFSKEGPTGSLNAGTLRAYKMEPIEFFDSGITVTDQTVLNVSTMVEGPDKIDVNTEGRWDFIITVENTSSDAVSKVASTRATVTNIQVINEVISNLIITGTVSDPPASIAGQIVTWDIPQLEEGESNTLRISATGFFSTVGPTGSLCIGTLTASGMEPIEFVDSGIIVIQSATTTTRGIDLFAEIE